MRRLILALSFSLMLAPAIAAQQLPSTVPPQTQPPSRVGGPPTTPSVVPPITATPGQQGAQGQRPGTTPPTMPPSLAAVAGLQAGSMQNVQLAIRISDSFSSEVQTTKTVTMLVADYQSGQIRSSVGESLINVDARPAIQRDGRIKLQLTVEYRPDLMAEQYEQLAKASKGSGVRVTMLTESLTLMVADGKPTLVSQSSDPRGDRKVSLEVTATIVK
ncbi:MAG TPA: hypothetical protein VN700_10060 [Vicinamibacterales bacterium]|nr:hypothetical protein [Vicinamibacterales bacterium]